MSSTNDTKTKGQAFVDYVVAASKRTEFRSALYRADTLAGEPRAWGILAPWCDLDNQSDRRLIAMIGASLVRTRSDCDGTLGLGQVVARCWPDGNKNPSAKALIQELINRQTSSDVLDVLQTILRRAEARRLPVCYAKLLDQVYYRRYSDPKTQWAAEFYGVQEALR